MSHMPALSCGILGTFFLWLHLLTYAHPPCTVVGQVESASKYLAQGRCKANEVLRLFRPAMDSGRSLVEPCSRTLTQHIPCFIIGSVLAVSRSRKKQELAQIGGVCLLSAGLR